MEKVVCLNHLLGLCKNCQDDTDTRHHPNNYDCSRFKLAVIYVIEVSAKLATEGKESDPII